MRKALMLIFFALLLFYRTQGPEPLFAKVWKEPVPEKTFEQVRLEVLELDLQSIGRNLSPYQLWLIYFWRGDYELLLDVETFTSALEAWKREGTSVTADLSELYYDTVQFYFRDLAAMIHNTDFSSHDKDFLELLKRTNASLELWSG
jgi:hypothetical protein